MGVVTSPNGEVNQHRIGAVSRIRDLETWRVCCGRGYTS